MQSVLCTILFGAFTFLYLYCFQDDMLAYAQYVLSGGTTTYNSLVGACIITGVLLLLSLLSSSTLSKSLRCLPALGHLPSVLVLAAITDINVIGNGQTNIFGYAWLVALVIFVIAFAFNCLANKMLFVSVKDSPVKGLCINLFMLFAMFVFAISCSNTSEIDHATLRSERLTEKGEYDKVIRVIDNSNANSQELTMLRAFSLANAGQLGECFFTPNMTTGSCSLLPLQPQKLQMLPKDCIYKTLGGIPSRGLTVKSYLETMYRRGCLSSMGKEYLLTACLLDKDLKSFAEHYAELKDSTDIQRNYSEALTLYAHLGGNVDAKFLNTEVEKSYLHFQAIKKKHPGKTLRENALRDAYGDTYWFYYFFTAS